LIERVKFDVHGILVDNDRAVIFGDLASKFLATGGVPSLIRYFAEDCVRRMNRRVKTIPAYTVATLTEHDWPGNIRELQNLIERAVILSPGAELQAPLDDLSCSSPAYRHDAQTLAEAEYEHILKALKATGWVVGGTKGAARRLGLKRTTLMGKMRKMGLSPSTEAALSSPSPSFT